MTNFQFIPYTLIAVGLINAVYRHNDSGAVSKSVLIILVGALLFLASRIKSLNNFMQRQATRIAILIVASLLILSTLR